MSTSYKILKKKRNELRDRYFLSTSYPESIKLKNKIQEFNNKLLEYELYNH